MKKAGIAILFFLCLTFIFIPVVGQNTFVEGSHFDAQQAHAYTEGSVYLGGIPIGVIANSEGIIVTDYVEVSADCFCLLFATDSLRSCISCFTGCLCFCSRCYAISVCSAVYTYHLVMRGVGERRFAVRPAKPLSIPWRAFLP